MLPTVAQRLWLSWRAGQPHANAYRLSWMWGTNIPVEQLRQTLLSHRRADWTPHLTDATGHWARARKHPLCRDQGGTQGRRQSARWTCYRAVWHRATHSTDGQRHGLNPLQAFWLHLSNHRSTLPGEIPWEDSTRRDCACKGAHEALSRQKTWSYLKTRLDLKKINWRTKMVA